jgi:hypothetical protein
MKRIFSTAIIASLFWVAAGAAPAAAQSAQSDVNQVIFSEIEKRAIKRFYEAIGLRNPDDKHSRDDRSHGKSDKSKKKKYKNKKHKGGKHKANRGKSKQLPPGLAKRRSLPPGLAKRQELPPGLAKRRLPTNLESQLSPLPAGVERAIVDNNVVLIQKGTNLILDVLENVLTK